MPATLTREDMNATVCRLAADQAGVDPATVTLDAHLFSDLNFDSLDAVEFTMSIEDEFDVSIRDEMAGEVKTVRQAADLLWPLLSSVAQPS
jgi:acyl carrier protein